MTDVLKGKNKKLSLGTEATMTIKDAKLNIYELNKQIISQLPPLDPVKFNDAVDTINNWGKGYTYMLYGKEISYFTLF